MRRRPTIHEQVWPKDSSFDAMSCWPREFGIQVLDRVWRAFDTLSADVLNRVQDWTDLEHIERSLTDLHFDKIVELQTGEEPFLPTREVPDFESRKSAMSMGAFRLAAEVLSAGSRESAMVSVVCGIS